eukprot:gene21057-biopygen14625
MAHQTQFKPNRSRPGLTTAALSLGSPWRASRKYATGESTTKKKITKENLVIGTWNVRSLSQSGKVELLAMKMDRMSWNILGISEMRWKDIGESFTDDGHKVWFCGNKNKNINGVGFMVNKNTKKAIMECSPVNERIVAIRIAGTPFNISVVQVYAPTSDCDDGTLEEFYDDLEELLRKIPKKDVLIVQRDWNTKIGPDAYQNWKGTVGKFGLGETNERGEKLLEFARRNNLIATNTLFLPFFTTKIA